LGDQRGIAKSLGLLASYFSGKGQFEEAEQLSWEALAIYREMGERLRFIRAASELGGTLNQAGKFAESRVLLEEHLLTFHNLGDHRSLALLNNELSYAILHLGQYEQASAHAQQGFIHFQEAGIPWLGVPLLALGQAALAQEAYIEAHRLLQESASIARQVGVLSFLALPLAALAYVERGLGNRREARQHLPEILQIALEKEALESLWYALPLVALLLADQGEQERAVELYALASRYPHVANSRWFEDVAGRHITAFAATLPPEVVAAAQARGRARDLWETARELLAELEQ
jgi:tetratricopeptide (TPR) repeat protein